MDSGLSLLERNKTLQRRDLEDSITKGTGLFQLFIERHVTQMNFEISQRATTRNRVSNSDFQATRGTVQSTQPHKL